MIPYSASSGRRRRSSDGSIEVYCSMCGDYICSTLMRIGSAMCVLCQASLNGVQLPQDLIRDYKLAKGSRTDVSVLLLPEEPKLIKKFSFRSMTGEILQAIGFLKKPVETEPPSKKASISKRRGRLFDNIQVGEPEDKK